MSKQVPSDVKKDADKAKAEADAIIKAKEEADAKVEAKEAKKEDKINYERWWSKQGPKHSIVGKRKASDSAPSMLTMKDYIFDCNLDTADGKQHAKDFRRSGFWGADLHIIGDIDTKTDEGKSASESFQACVVQVLEEEEIRGLRHLACMLTNHEAIKYGINKHLPEKAKLLNILFTKKSFVMPNI